MKRILFLTAIITLAAIRALAGDEIIIMPQAVKAGATYDDATTFSIEMKNETAYTAIQLDIYVPEGFVIDEVDLSEDRFPFTKDRKGNITWFHNVGIQKHADFYRLVFASPDNAIIEGNSGVLCDVYYQSDKSLTDIIPIKVSNVEMADPDNVSICNPSEYASFFYTEDTDWKTVTHLDLAASGCRTLPEVFEAARNLLKNPNALIYLDENSAADDMENVVIGENCQKLVLTNAEPFHAPKAFTATSATYSRAIANDGWHTLCLPFAANAPAGVSVERFDCLDKENSTICFKNGEIEADKPCIFSAQTGTVQFYAENAEIKATPEKMTDEALVGTYRLLGKEELKGNYVLSSDGKAFVAAESAGDIKPFQAVVSTEGVANILEIKHNGSGINPVESPVADSFSTFNRYNLQGQQVQQDFKGIVIEHGRKVINK